MSQRKADRRVGKPRWVSIVGAIPIALGLRRVQVTTVAVQTFGLAFEVLGVYGIAAAGAIPPPPSAAGPTVLSLEAAWILAFATLVPSPSRPGWVAALVAGTAMPIVAALGFMLRDVTPHGGVWEVVLTALSLYLVVATLAASAVYRLGTPIMHPRELGAYHLVERLGVGGMAEVWRADHRWLARPAAIKLIRDSAGTAQRPAETRARFEQEAQVTASLQSPHTIQVYDFGLTDDGAFYYVMELLEGLDLQTLVERFGPVPVERAVHLLTQVCESLAEAHERGIVHRDIKPSNLFACRYGRDVDVVKVLDFGLVKAVRGKEAEPQAALTAESVTRGTPAFMSPEQALADPTVDGRADLYALGCVAFWLVTGKSVFTGSSAIDIIMKHVQTPAEAPSQHTELPIPRTFDALVLALLAKDRSARPATADAVRERLAGLGTARSWTAADGRAWWQTHAPRGN